jgi:hypothetical protein
MNWEQWLAANQMNIDFGESSIDLMRRAYIAGLAKAHDLLDNAPPEDFHWCRHEIEKLIEESQ